MSPQNKRNNIALIEIQANNDKQNQSKSILKMVCNGLNLMLFDLNGGLIGFFIGREWAENLLGQVASCSSLYSTVNKK